MVEILRSPCYISSSPEGEDGGPWWVGWNPRNQWVHAGGGIGSSYIGDITEKDNIRPYR